MKMKSLISKLFFCGLICLGASSCTTKPVEGMESNIISQSDYEKILEQNTKSIEKYNGLYNTANVSATLLRPSMVQTQLKQSARLYQWDPVKFQDELKKKTDQMAKTTEIFVSFYTPEKKHDDLNKSQTLWKIFLDVEGKRFEGKATKIKLLTNEVQGLYPYHTRFGTPYNITFPVSATSVGTNPAKLTITGTVDSISLDFQSLKE